MRSNRTVILLLVIAVILAGLVFIVVRRNSRIESPAEPTNPVTTPHVELQGTSVTSPLSPLSPLSAATVTSQDVEAGLSLYRDGRYEEAFALFDQAIDQGVDLARAHGGKAAIYVAWRRYNEAIQEYSTALSYAQLPDLLTGRCNALRLLLRFDEAQKDCDAALELDPKNPEPYLVIASIHLDQGDTSGARDYAARVLEDLNPDSSEAAFLLGLVALQEGDAQEAMAQFTQAIELNPEEPQYYWERGFLALGLGQVDQARTDMEAILRVGNPRKHGELLLRASTQLNFLGGKEQPVEQSSP